jgi:hypothetical protein
MNDYELGVMIVAGALGQGPLQGGDLCPECVLVGDECLSCRMGRKQLERLVNALAEERL